MRCRHRVFLDIMTFLQLSNRGYTKNEIWQTPFVLKKMIFSDDLLFSSIKDFFWSSLSSESIALLGFGGVLSDKNCCRMMSLQPGFLKLWKDFYRWKPWVGKAAFRNWRSHAAWGRSWQRVRLSPKVIYCLARARGYWNCKSIQTIGFKVVLSESRKWLKSNEVNSPSSVARHDALLQCPCSGELTLYHNL